MTAISAASAPPESQAYRAILWGGLIAGTLDITAAFINSGLHGVGPLRVLRSIASGLLGAQARNGGIGTAALGLGLHFLIALGAATVYYAASRKLNLLTQHAIICGVLYGILVYLVMNLIVLPLSAIYFKPSYTPSAVVTGLIIHMLCVGLPIALVVRSYAK